MHRFGAGQQLLCLVGAILSADPTKFAASRTGIDGDSSNAVALAAQVDAPDLEAGLGTDGRLPDDFLEKICQQRSSTPSRLRKELSGELEAIVAHTADENDTVDARQIQLVARQHGGGIKLVAISRQVGGPDFVDRRDLVAELGFDAS